MCKALDIPLNVTLEDHYAYEPVVKKQRGLSKVKILSKNETEAASIDEVSSAPNTHCSSTGSPLKTDSPPETGSSPN